MTGRVRVVAPTWLKRMATGLTVDGVPACFDVPVAVSGPAAQIGVELLIQTAEIVVHASMRCRADVVEGRETVVGTA